MNEETNTAPETTEVPAPAETAPAAEDAATSEGAESGSLKTLGPIIGILILILIGILGGLYLWGSTLTTEDIVPPADNSDTGSLEAPAVSTSDDLSAIEVDVDASVIDSLDSEMSAIDAELNSLEQELNAQ